MVCSHSGTILPSIYMEKILARLCTSANKSNACWYITKFRTVFFLNLNDHFKFNCVLKFEF